MLHLARGWTYRSGDVSQLPSSSPPRRRFYPRVLATAGIAGIQYFPWSVEDELLS
jgi:hypothetical protein